MQVLASLDVENLGHRHNFSEVSSLVAEQLWMMRNISRENVKFHAENIFSQKVQQAFRNTPSVFVGQPKPVRPLFQIVTMMKIRIIRNISPEKFNFHDENIFCRVTNSYSGGHFIFHWIMMNTVLTRNIPCEKYTERLYVSSS